MFESIPYPLNDADREQIRIIARAIHFRAEPLNRAVVARYGMDVFQQQQPTTTLRLDFTFILYHFPGVIHYIRPFIDDEPRIDAFENAVALYVHLLATRRLLPEAGGQYVQP